MLKNVTVFMLLLAVMVPVIVLASTGNDNSAQTVTGQPKQESAKQNVCTDLGKGLPYPGMTAAEIAKLNDHIKSSSTQADQPNKQKSDIKKVKPISGTNSVTATGNNNASVSPKEKIDVTTDSGKGNAYPGLSQQEQQKLQNAGGK
jgi:hypothetical protein